VQFLFSDHTLDTDLRELRRDREVLAVEPQVFDLLVYLVRNRDRVVSKDDLIASIWEGRIVSESTLTSRINATRTAVGDNGKEQRLIRTVARKGLRFVGDVQESSNGVKVALAADPTEDAPLQPMLSAERPAIAVLPFTNIGGDPEQDYFSDGISEDIITALSRLRWFLVMSRNSSFDYKGKPAQMKHVAEELGVRYVLEGSVRTSGAQVRITAQLNDVTSGSQIWAEYYDRDLTDVFAVQDDITESIVAAVEQRLYAAESFRARRKPPHSMDPWDLLMQALSHYWRITPQDLEIAQTMLEKAIAIDPHYGQALGLLATSLAYRAHMGWVDSATAVPLAERAAMAAISADSEDPWAHHALACAYLLARRFDDSLSEFELALHLNPSFALAQGYYGLALAYCGHWEEADLAAQRALRLSPRDPLSALYVGIASFAQYMGHNYEEAMRLARESIRRRGDFVGSHRVLTAAAGMAGYTEVASNALRELRRVQPNISLEWIAKQMPLQREADMAHYMEGMRRAGLE
jgi:TolB-like protein